MLQDSKHLYQLIVPPAYHLVESLTLHQRVLLEPFGHEARDAIAVIVNPENPVDNLTLEQISDIYSGKINNWQEVGAMEACENCELCRQNCPTGSIPFDRFLIHAENCLGFLNEMEPDFPYWVHLQPDWHNALIGCMRCQFVCPVNKPYLDNIAAGPSFSEEETGLIMNKTPLEDLSPATRQKLKISDGVYSLLAPNLSALIEKQREVMRR